LSSSEASQILSSKPTGTFMIRFSSLKGFAISFTDTTDVKHVPVQITREGYMMDGRSFNSMGDIIKHYSYVLKIPFSNTQQQVTSFVPIDTSYMIEQ
jgi:hypothetical protein